MYLVATYLVATNLLTSYRLGVEKTMEQPQGIQWTLIQKLEDLDFC